MRSTVHPFLLARACSFGNKMSFTQYKWSGGKIVQQCATFRNSLLNCHSMKELSNETDKVAFWQRKCLFSDNLFSFCQVIVGHLEMTQQY